MLLRIAMDGKTILRAVILPAGGSAFLLNDQLRPGKPFGPGAPIGSLFTGREVEAAMRPGGCAFSVTCGVERELHARVEETVTGPELVLQSPSGDRYHAEEASILDVLAQEQRDFLHAGIL